MAFKKPNIPKVIGTIKAVLKRTHKALLRQAIYFPKLLKTNYYEPYLLIHPSSNTFTQEGCGS